jgi:hypothetical protein
MNQRKGVSDDDGKHILMLLLPNYSRLKFLFLLHEVTAEECTFAINSTGSVLEDVVFKKRHYCVNAVGRLSISGCEEVGCLEVGDSHFFAD